MRMESLLTPIFSKEHRFKKFFNILCTDKTFPFEVEADFTNLTIILKEYKQCNTDKNIYRHCACGSKICIQLVHKIWAPFDFKLDPKHHYLFLKHYKRTPRKSENHRGGCSCGSGVTRYEQDLITWTREQLRYSNDIISS